MRVLIARIRDWLRRDELDTELTEELQFHRAQLERDAAAKGANADQARRRANLRLGNVTNMRETTRGEWSIPSLDNFQQDLRHAVRGLLRAPGFTATVIVTLALGIGANAAMFGVIDRLMFRPLAYLHDPGSVNRMYWQWQNRGEVTNNSSTYYTRFLDMQQGTKSFSKVAAWAPLDLAIGQGERARQRRVDAVSASYFDLFDATPVLGRFFAADEDVVPRGADVAVLSYGFWVSEYGRRDVRNELLQIGDIRATIIGVAPAGFNGVNDDNPPVAFIPITTYAASSGTNDSKSYYTRYQWGWVHVLARRKPGVSVAQAEADATDALRRSWASVRADDPGYPPLDTARPRVVVSAVRPGGGPAPSLEVRTAVWTGGVAVIVLLIAGANVANLFLVRALRRRRETAVRLALGVSRSRLVAQWVAESLVVAMTAGVAALIVAQWAGVVLQKTLLPSAAGSRAVFTDVRTLTVTFALTLLTGVLVGLIPALMSGRGDLTAAFRGGMRGGTSDGKRLRATLLVVQAGLSVVLLIGATLFVRSLNAVQSLPLGYDADRVLYVQRFIQQGAFNDSAQLPLRRVLLSTAQSLPEVESAAWVSSTPFLNTSTKSLFVAGIDSTARLGSFSYQATTLDYFRTMRTRIVRGREFTREDADPVAVVGESMANALWPGQDPIGKCFRMASPTAPCLRVVGVSEDISQRSLTERNAYHYYILAEQYTGTWGNGLLVRTRGDPAVEAERVRIAIQRVIPGASYVTVRPLRDVVEKAQVSWRMGATVFVALGVLALIVAAIGLYGVIGYDVAQRMHELGVRSALGARASDIVRLVVGQGLWFAVAGATIGMVTSLLAARWIQPLLFEQSARDPAIYIGVSAVITVVAIAASAIPALRATRVDPSLALRSD